MRILYLVTNFTLLHWGGGGGGGGVLDIVKEIQNQFLPVRTWHNCQFGFSWGKIISTRFGFNSGKIISTRFGFNWGKIISLDGSGLVQFNNLPDSFFSLDYSILFHVHRRQKSLALKKQVKTICSPGKKQTFVRLFKENRCCATG